ncbi:hypothetical protein Enr10x_06730 [Gimesia panareensis]|uniref:Cytochrome c domain-containing protein n=1 Tax=Gimesia panareensis TaxID=2527978 RepID=A0A517Q163_9PLAN|nr:hypothetical protein [Gimesia panareensis]QDT25378.1 hypothetical protein Enr10x_06730 [Gimesia panareensis]
MKVSPKSKIGTTFNLSLCWWTVCLAVSCLSGTGSASAQVNFEEAPINYNKATPDNAISRVQKKLDAGELKLAFDREERRGYLPAVLEALKIPISSQILVFSKTSLQVKRIDPLSPRALYYNDDLYLGFVQGGSVLEVSASDPQLGTVFYTLSQFETSRPKFVRKTFECTQCHAGSMTQGVPGHIMRSVYPGPDGMPVFREGTYRSDQSSPFEERWGGWYVSGTHGKMRHMGNLIFRQGDNSRNLNRDKGANADDLERWFDTDPYMTPYSDIVSLMVLEHQAKMHNLITRAQFEGRITERDSRVMNKMLERKAAFQSDSTKRRYESSAKRLVDYMLFVDELQLEDRIEGLSGFQTEFPQAGPRDSKGRSLRDFDLERRLFKYPCSYLIYSDSFEALPKPVLEVVYRQLWEVLTGKNQSKEFAHLSAEDRRAILEILIETRKGLPDYWKL